MKNIKLPKNQRAGQTIFNFLEWLRIKGYGSGQSGRMADPFYIEDKKLEKLYKEYVKQTT